VRGGGMESVKGTKLIKSPIPENSIKEYNIAGTWKGIFTKLIDSSFKTVLMLCRLSSQGSIRQGRCKKLLKILNAPIFSKKESNFSV
jgi:hypothetical protein